VACDGDTYAYSYRLYAPSDSSYERCVGLAWCSMCREYSGAMVYVPPSENLPDLLADLPTPERERLPRSEVKLLDYLDRLVRRGIWPAADHDQQTYQRRALFGQSLTLASGNDDARLAAMSVHLIGRCSCLVVIGGVRCVCIADRLRHML
jgi:hypothetical protein